MWLIIQHALCDKHAERVAVRVGEHVAVAERMRYGHSHDVCITLDERVWYGVADGVALSDADVEL